MIKRLLKKIQIKKKKRVLEFCLLFGEIKEIEIIMVKSIHSQHYF